MLQFASLSLSPIPYYFYVSLDDIEESIGFKGYDFSLSTLPTNPINFSTNSYNVQYQKLLIRFKFTKEYVIYISKNYISINNRYLYLQKFTESIIVNLFSKNYIIYIIKLLY